MAMGRHGQRQGDLMLAWDELPRSPGHPFYDKLQELLDAAGFDAHAESVCQPFYAEKMGARSIPPGRYFRMHLTGYFEGIDSERGLEWRCGDSLSLREFLRLSPDRRVPDHSSLSRIRTRLPLEVHQILFEFVLKRLAEKKPIVGKRLGFDASTMAANAALRNIESRRDGLKKMADSPWTTRICEPDRPEFYRWNGDEAARRAVYNNRARLKSGVAKEALKLRAEKVERSFQHTLDRGGMRRVHLRGNENIRKRYLIHVAGFNLLLVMRQALGYGTPRGFADERKVCFVLIYVTTEAAAATYPAIQVVIQAAVGTGSPIVFSRHTTFAERL